MRARGLKLVYKPLAVVELESRPMRARGLKHDLGLSVNSVSESRPMRARGLKHAGQHAEVFVAGRAPCGRVG